MPIERKTGPGYAYILCDVCGRKIRQKDAILITDRYNTQSNLLVCKEDADKTNPQNIPFSISELNITSPKLVRSEPPDTNVINENSDRAPSPPTFLVATMHPINSHVMLTWQGSDNPGSDPVEHYIITRASPQDSIYITIDTVADVTMYEDTTADITLFYSYIIYAVNVFGTSDASNTAYFPKMSANTSDGYKYLVISQSPNSLLQTGNGQFIRVRPPV